MQRIVELTQRLEHHLLVPKQYKGGGTQLRDSKSVVWWWGEKMVYYGVPTKASFGRNTLLGRHFAQKRQVKG